MVHHSIMWRCMLMFGLALSAGADKSVINDAVDILIESGIEVLKEKGQDKVHIPDLDKQFDVKILGDYVAHGKFHASGGLFQDTTSIKRTGDVTMETRGDEVILTASMGFGLLSVDFTEYSLDFLAVHSSGSIHAASSNNSLSAVLSVVRPPGSSICTVELQHAQITDLGDFDVKLTGPGDVNKIGSMLLPWILNHFNDVIRGQINKHVEDAMRKALKKVNICDKLPF